MARLQRIDPGDNYYISADDHCYHYGEYTSHGGFHASETNDQISNFKKKPTSADAVLKWKRRAIQYWCEKLADALNLSAIAATVTLVPAPCSKPRGHPDHDNRVLELLRCLAARHPGLDIREVVIQARERPAQHEGGRLGPDEIEEALEIDQAALATPVRPNIIVVDDVFTLGATFVAIQRKLKSIPGVVNVAGIFLAKTVWPTPDPAIVFGFVDENQ
jgi:predicted amidophosphoribosyltransferase